MTKVITGDKIGFKKEYTDNDWYRGFIEAYAEDNVIFLHLEVKQWNHTALKIMREDMDNILTKAWDLGLDYVCAYGNDPKARKFLNLIKPTDFEQSFGPQNMNTLSVWETYMKE